ncbi:hypothetical protein [Falsihalocynthiibacter sp. CO-5D18]|uniref:hypothetical protein n=1 Tax=Falsihalocynthiibacter sp. CO-5D18 TaxID=3240872 RepID=UPI003510976B
MIQGINNGVAKFLATFLLVNMMSSAAQSQDLTLPQDGAEPVILPLIGIHWAQVRPSELLEVFVGPAEPCCEGRIAITGQYTRTDDALTFLPAFGFETGQDYVARIRISEANDDFVSFSIPPDGLAVDALVTATYPSGDILPENVLRFYIHFSTPMSPQVAFDYIKLRDAAGNVDDAAFMRFKQELWNEDRTRLTVLIDPGRIKRKVATNVELGPALRAGQLYTLSVEGGWPSADGASVLPPFSRTFSVSLALRERPDVSLWQATVPCVGTTDSLYIAFDRPFDRHLLSKDIQVAAGDGQIVDGTVHVGEGETSWSFTPNDVWTQSELVVHASTELEDVAGNNFHDLLDHLETTAETEVATSALPINLNSCSQ